MMSLHSHLYVPGDRTDMLARAEARSADAVIIDLEDSVPRISKAAALANALDHLAHTPTRTQRWVRINGGERGLKEIGSLLDTRGLHGVWIPKAEPGAWLATILRSLESSRTRIGLLIESAVGLSRLAAFPELPPDTLLQLGEVDLAASLGMTDRSGEAMRHFRMQLVLESACRGLPSPVAPVSTAVSRLDQFARETATLRGLGFGSRACVHPGQVGVANEVFATSDEDRQQARDVIARHEAMTATSVGSYIGSSGEMEDEATVRLARALLSASDLEADR